MNWDDIKGQLERYGDAPQQTLLPVLDNLARLNDDLWHDRSKEIIDDGFKAVLARVELLRKQYSRLS